MQPQMLRHGRPNHKREEKEEQADQAAPTVADAQREKREGPKEDRESFHESVSGRVVLCGPPAAGQETRTLDSGGEGGDVPRPRCF